MSDINYKDCYNLMCPKCVKTTCTGNRTNCQAHIYKEDYLDALAKMSEKSLENLQKAIKENE